MIGLAVEEGPHPALKKTTVFYYALILLFFLLSLLSKSAAVVLPLVMFLVDFLLKRKFTMKTVAEKIPFLLLSLLFGILAMQSQKNAIQVDYGTLVTPERRFFLVNWGFLRYLVMMFIPKGLAAFHTYPDLTGGRFPAMVYLSPVINLGLFGLVAYSLRFTRIVFFGVFFFLITILLVLQILPVGGALIAERYTYVPYIGLFLILAYYAVFLLQKNTTPVMVKLLTIAVLTGFSAGFLVTTYQRIAVWKDALTLWRDVVKKYPGQNYNSYYQLGTALKKNNQPDEALEAFDISLKLKPSALTYNNRGNIYNSRKQYDLAMKDYEAALNLDPTLHTAYNNRGVIEATLGDYGPAMRDFSKAISLKQDYTDAYRNRGQIKQLQNDLQGALADWEIAASYGDEAAAKLLTEAKIPGEKSKQP
jgi:tetratricopeptide (TPR) repeat protein